ncbi:Arginase [Candidatus Hepatincolaceae symbiont of Richtersius coronifer]
MDIKDLKVLGVASGFGAQTYGAQIGVWDIYYNLNKIHPNLIMDKTFSNPSSHTKLEIIPSLSALYQEFNQYLAQIHKDKNKYLFFTGDHSNGFGIWSAVSNLYQEDLGLIWIDAHLDCHTPETSPSKNLHGMPVAHLLGFGSRILHSLIKNKLKPSNICFIGTQDYEQEEINFIDKLNIKAFYMKDIQENNIQQVFKEALDIVTKNTHKFGVSLDIDVMSNDCVPGTGCYTELGLQVKHIQDNLEILSAHPQFIGLEITEYNPYFDKERLTFEVIAKIVRSTLKGLDF